MGIEIITLPFCDEIQGFDPAPLESLYRRAEVFEVTPRFFTRFGRPYWTILARVRVRPATEEGLAGERPPSWREAIAPQDHGLFENLREWRARIADARGVPAYVVFTNRQLAAICKIRPTSLAGLGRIQGVGSARLRKYGRDLLGIVADDSPTTPNHASTDDAIDEESNEKSNEESNHDRA